MINNTLRNGNFTSSEIVALTKLSKDKKDFGAPALTYIEETNFERRLGRSLSTEITARPLVWGKLVEGRVFDLLGLEYVLCSTDTIGHPEIAYWSGSPDGFKNDQGGTVMDIKAPITLKSFCQLVQPLYDGLTGTDAMNAIRDNHKDGDKYYWQLVSNAILKNTRYAELIVYLPYYSELPEIRYMASCVEGSDMSKHYFIAMANDEDLPFLLDGGYYKNLNVIRFEVPESDKKLLTAQVLKAGAMLIGEQPAVVVPAIEDANTLKL